MSFTRRMVAFGVSLVFGILFWGAVLVLAVLVWERGVGRSVGEGVGLLRGALDVFLGEYQKAVREKERERARKKGWGW